MNSTDFHIKGKGNCHVDWRLNEIFCPKTMASLCEVFRDEIFYFITIS